MLDTLTVVLTLTLPSSIAATHWIPPDQRDSFEDSVAVGCDPGSPLTDLDSLRFYALPTQGGAWVRVYAKAVRGREGQSDTTTLAFPGWSGAHLYVTTTRIGFSPESCASPVVYKGPVTGVPLEIPPSSSSELTWYDVRGRRLAGAPRGSGIYFVVWRDHRGRTISRAQKVPVFRGAPLVRIRPP